LSICWPQLESLPAMVAGVWSDDNSQQLEATTQFRKLLSIGNCGLILFDVIVELLWCSGSVC